MNNANKLSDLDKYRNKKHQHSMKSRLYIELEKVSEHNAVVDEYFILAWKQSMPKLGLEFFSIKTNIEEAKGKNDSRPNYGFIKYLIFWETNEFGE